MTYVAPEFTLIGHASGVVLGAVMSQFLDPDGTTSDPQLSSDTEW